MTPDVQEHIDNLHRCVENCANLAETLSRRMLGILDGGSRGLLDSQEAAELDVLLGDVGVRCQEYRDIARKSRELMADVTAMEGTDQ